MQKEHPIVYSAASNPPLYDVPFPDTAEGDTRRTITDAHAEELRGIVKGEVFLTSDPKFAEYTVVFNRGLRTPAQLLVRPLDSADVSQVLLFCTRHAFSPSIKAGGYGTHCWSIAGDVIVDLSAIHDIAFDTPGPNGEYVGLRDLKGKGKSRAFPAPNGVSLRRTRDEAFAAPQPGDNDPGAYGGSKFERDEEAEDAARRRRRRLAEPQRMPPEEGGLDPLSMPGGQGGPPAESSDLGEYRPPTPEHDVPVTMDVSGAVEAARENVVDHQPPSILKVPIPSPSLNMPFFHMASTPSMEVDQPQPFARPAVSTPSMDIDTSNPVTPAAFSNATPNPFQLPFAPPSHPTASSSSSSRPSPFDPPSSSTTPQLWNSTRPSGSASAFSFPGPSSASSSSASAAGPFSFGASPTPSFPPAPTPSFPRITNPHLPPSSHLPPTADPASPPLVFPLTYTHPYALVTFGAGVTQKAVDQYTSEHPLPARGADGSAAAVPYHVPFAAHPVGSAVMMLGGFGFVSRLRGLSMDNLVEVEMVLADGRVVVINEHENTDLWWAVRGAGPAFGVAVRYVAKAYPCPVVFAGNLLYNFNPSTAPSLLKHYRDCVKSAPRELYANCLLTAGPAGRGAIIVIQMCYSGPRAEGAAFLEAILSWTGERCLLNEVNEKGFMDQQDSVAKVLRAAGGAGEGGEEGRSWFIRSDLVRTLTDEMIHKTVMSFAETTDGCTWLFELAGGALTDFENTCLPLHQREAAFTVVAFHKWPTYGGDDDCIVHGEEWILNVMGPASSGGPLPCFAERCERLDRIIGTYGKANFARLCDLKGKYDPNGLFRHCVWPLDEHGQPVRSVDARGAPRSFKAIPRARAVEEAEEERAARAAEAEAEAGAA